MSVWEVEFTDQFHEWWLDLTSSQQEALTARVQLLQEHGPTLGRPTVDSIVGSRHQNMKELRVSEGGQLRVLFAFDTQRTAILLIGGNKSDTDDADPDWNEWYQAFVLVADALLDEHERTLGSEQRKEP